ncbi:hypothetical protein [Streptomyces drozdowiczii]|uniref:Minor tail protein n=1 Tax=Streptomyces drozdowiczii TaxID=202862 RepID=A0ABY6PQR5_9ACTN|nr:hypothetical protein [Streptomyces drozdowiczii]MCX0246405.1 hypothetical protein [Streptomyces drozdowiczii]UZK54091.1 hypothetical protein NEH16_07925 [Streptomyces drozdowiczii]
MPASYAVIEVDFTAAPGTDTSYRMERATAPAGPYVTIAVAAPLLAERAVYTDSTAPFDTVLYYRATGDQTGAVTTYTAGPLDQAGQVWLRDPLRPWADLPLDFCDAAQSGHVPGCAQPTPELVWVGLGDEVWEADAGLFPVLNSETPADVWARRKHASGSLTFFTRTLAAIDRVYTLFTAGGPLLLQLPPEYGVRDRFIQPGNVTEIRISRDQRRPERRWEAPFTVVDRPLGPAQGTACANWCALPAAYPTYGDLPSGLTLADLAAGEVICPGGEPVTPLVDTFTRTVAAGWGTADTGQAWTVATGPAAEFSVNGSAGIHTHTTLNTLHATTIPWDQANVTMRTRFSVSTVPTGTGGNDIHLMLRRGDASNFYSARIFTGTTGSLMISLRKFVGGVETQLVSATPGFTYVADAVYAARFSVQGSNLMAKVWPAASPEPAAWQVTATDTDLTGPGAVGMRTLVRAAQTNPLPITFRFDDLVVTS